MKIITTNVSRITAPRLPNSNMSSHEKAKQTRNPFKAKVLHRVLLHLQDVEREKKRVLDPQGEAIRRWSKIFLGACLVSLFVDPLFFFLPKATSDACIDIENTLQNSLTIIRSAADVFHVIHILVKFNTAYVAPYSRVFGKGVLVTDRSKIALRYLSKDFWIDLLASLPLPQVVIWVTVPYIRGSIASNTKDILWLTIMFQYIPRVYLIFPLTSEIVDAAGVVTKTAWAGAAYNLILYMLASHVLGACWYLLAIGRQKTCWRSLCLQEQPTCQNEFFDCRRVQDPARVGWFQSSNVTSLCTPGGGLSDYGIYSSAVTPNVIGSTFYKKYLSGFWWGLQQLSCFGQTLVTSTYPGELLFAIIVATLGLILFGLLIGNMQNYLQSTTTRLEQWRVKRTDVEQWMHHRQLPSELRQSIREYEQFKWVATRGVDEEAILQSLPIDLRRATKRHLCLSLVKQVPLFSQMDDTILDVVCERLKPVLCTRNTFLVREEDPVNQMLFIVRGHLESFTTDGGRTGFFNSSRLCPGDFCGEELLTWALDPRPNIILPSSTRTVKTIAEVEAFSLSAEDLKFVASQFRRLHSKEVRHTFRFHSHQWRTWAACFIQAAWRRYKRLKLGAELRDSESNTRGKPTATGSFWNKYAEQLVKSSRNKSSMRRSGLDLGAASSLQKPAEPDFSIDG